MLQQEYSIPPTPETQFVMRNDSQGKSKQKLAKDP